MEFKSRFTIAIKEKRPFDEIIKIIKSAEAGEINLKNPDGETALHEAICCGEPDHNIEAIVRRLIKKGADVNARDNGGWTPLYKACWGGDNDSKYNTITLLIKSGADVNASIYWIFETPLQQAAHRASVLTVKALLKNGANVNAQDIYGSSTLHTAIFYSREDIVRCLIEYGADANIKDKFGLTPLHSFASHLIPNFFIGRMLIENGGADVNANSKWQGTPLHIAASRSTSITSAFLIENGANARAVDCFGSTPLHCAVKGRTCRELVINFFLRIGADISVRDKYGDTPVDIAKRNGYDNIIKEFENLYKT